MGILRPKISLLTDQYKQKILEEAKAILDQQGVLIENKDAELLFKDQGIKFSDQRCFIPPEISSGFLSKILFDLIIYFILCLIFIFPKNILIS